MKRKQVSNKTDNKEYLKGKKKLYKHKEKLQTNETHDEKVVLYKEGMTVKDLADSLGEAPATLIKKLFDLGALANLNQSIDFSTAELLVVDYGKELVKEETRDIANFEEYEIIDNAGKYICQKILIGGMHCNDIHIFCYGISHPVFHIE